MARKCPLCKLLSPEEAESCDCGYDFRLGRLRARHPIGTQRPAGTRSRVPWWAGLLCLIVGAFLSLTSYASASGGGRFSIFWGMVFLGLWWFLADLIRRSR